MNKKGFTLVEILAVIVILSLIITIVATNGFGAFNNTKDKINEQTINEIKESTKVLMTDVMFCEEELDSSLLYTLKIDTTPDGKYTCEELQTTAKDIGIKVTLEELISLGYITGNNIEEFKDNNPDYEITGKIIDNKIEITLPEGEIQ